MAHVIASHAAIREDQARQVALVTRVVNDVLAAIPSMGALALAKSKITLASFSRAQEFEADGIGVGIAARAGYDPYGAVRFLTSMGRNAELKRAARRISIRARPTSSPRIRRRPSASRMRRPMRASSARPAAAASATARPISRRSTAWSTAKTRAKASCAGRRFLHPKLGFTFSAPEGFALDNTAQAVLGVKEGGGQALRLDVVRVPAEQTLAEYLNSGWIENIDPKSVEDFTDQRLPRRDRDRQRRPVGVPAVRGALRQRRLSLHLRGQEDDARRRPRVPRIRSAASAG